VLMPSQHILRYACKFKSDSAQEAQLTVGTLDAKLDELSSASNKVRNGLLCARYVQVNGVLACWSQVAHTFAAGVSKTSPHVADAAHVGPLHALDSQHRHQGSQGASNADMCWPRARV